MVIAISVTGWSVLGSFKLFLCTLSYLILTTAWKQLPSWLHLPSPAEEAAVCKGPTAHGHPALGHWSRGGSQQSEPIVPSVTWATTASSEAQGSLFTVTVFQRWKLEDFISELARELPQQHLCLCY